nr:C25 family cysteine peptidase [uncultured Desulfobacter sp.]
MKYQLLSAWQLAAVAVSFFWLSSVVPLHAGEWINVLNPAQTLPTDQMASSGEEDGEYQTIPDLNVVSETGNAADKNLHIKYDVHSVLKDSVQADKMAYDTLFVPGCGYHFGTGEPDIPAKSIFIRIPSNSSYSVHVDRTKTTELDAFDFLPVQPLPHDNMEYVVVGFEKDDALYSRDAFFPKDNLISTREFKVRCQRMLEIIVTPMQYNPVSKTVKMAPTLDIHVDLKESGPGNQTDTVLSSSGYSDVFSGGFYQVQDSNSPARPLDGQTSLERYMILANDQFLDNERLKEFILWKKKKGYKVRLVGTGEVNKKAGNNDTFNNCVKFLRALPANEYPNFLLIIGDHRKNEGIQTLPIKTYVGGYSDLPLACQDTHDYLQDLCYGRLPAANDKELSTMLEKILAMDQNPPQHGMYDKLIFAGQLQDRQNNVTWKEGQDGHADRLFFETGDAVACYFEHHSKINYTCTSVFENPAKITPSGFWNKNGLLWGGEKIGQRPFPRFVAHEKALPVFLDTLNKGVALVQYRAHGLPGGWGHPEFTSSHIDTLKNGRNLPVVFSVTCLTGAYHCPRPTGWPDYKGNFSTKLLSNPAGGAYGVIAAVDVSFSWTNDMFIHGMYTAFLEDYIRSQNESVNPKWTKKLSEPTLFNSGSATRLGEILNSGLLFLYEKYNMELTPITFELFHLFGDPESFIRLHAPTPFTGITHPSDLSAGNASKIQIKGIAKGALVCLYSSDENVGIHQAKVAQSDNVTFEVTPKAKGTIFVTVSQYDKIPYQGKMMVTPGSTAPSKEKPNSETKQNSVINVLGDDQFGSGSLQSPDTESSEYKSVF